MSLASRMDNRTFEEFQNQLSFNAKTESLLGELFRIQLSFEKKAECVVIETGVGPDGEVITGNLKKSTLDKLYTWVQDGHTKELAVEIKTAPTNCKNFFTFKVSSLKTCVQNNGIFMLFARSEPNGYYWASTQQCLTLLENRDIPSQIYKGFSPNDAAKRIYPEEYHTYMTRESWCKEALEFLKLNVKTLMSDPPKAAAYGGRYGR